MACPGWPGTRRDGQRREDGCGIRPGTPRAGAAQLLGLGASRLPVTGIGRVSGCPSSDQGGDDMPRIVVVGDLMTDTVAHAALPLARGSDTPATVTMHGGGSGANIAAWLAVDGSEVAFVGRRGADIAGRNRDMVLM